MGYNGSFLGPVIRVSKGEQVNVHVNNKLKEATTVHWHGLEVEGEKDGALIKELNQEQLGSLVLQ